MKSVILSGCQCSLPGKPASWLFLIVIIALSCSSVWGQPQLLRDVNTEFDMSFIPYSSLTSTPSQVFYISGATLWVTKGSPASTIPLKRFDVIAGFTVVGSNVYFAADDGMGSGTELWKSNGTVSGTVRVADVFPGSHAAEPTYITAVNATTIFFSAKNGKNGRELWKTNGTPGGTVMVKDIRPVTGSSSPALITKVGNRIYFVANDGQNGIELWRSDGTAAGTVIVKDIYPGIEKSSRPQWLTEVNGKLFFRAEDGISGFELYQSDGTAAGTRMVKDIRAGIAAGDIENLINVNGYLLFTANDGVHGDELWRSDGTSIGTVLIKDLNPGGGGSNPTSSWMSAQPMDNFTNINGILFFTAGKGEAERFVVRSDGTAAGTYRVTDLQEVALNDLQPCFTYLNGFIYFFNQLDRNDYHLFRMDINGRNVTAIREYTTPLYYYANFNQYMVAFGNALYATALHPDGWSIEKQFPDGKTVTLSSGKGPTAGSDPEQFVRSNNLMYFNATVGFVEPDYELWRTDGTPDGTIRVADLGLGNHELLAVGDRLYFNHYDELYVTSGTPETTVKLVGFFYPSLVRSITNVNGIVYFHNSMGDLWKSDGTPAGTRKVGTLQYIISITNVNGKAFVLNLTESGGLELWRTTTTGLTRVKVIRSGVGVASESGATASVGNIYYFIGNDGIHGNELWRSDGTTSGTFMVSDLNTIDSVSYTGNEGDIGSFIVFNKKLYFSAVDDHNKWQFMMVTGRNSVTTISSLMPAAFHIIYNEKLYLFTPPSNNTNPWLVWMIDATSPRALSFIGFAADAPTDEAVVDGHLYFSNAWTPLMEITDCGVAEVDVANTRAYPIEGLGEDLIFGGNFQGDIEPFIYRNIATFADNCSSAGRTADDTLSASHSGPWPNPYTESFTLRVPGGEGKVDVVIFDGAGSPIERFIGLDTNVDYPNMGVTLPKGFYLMKTRYADKVTSQRLIKK